MTRRFQVAGSRIRRLLPLILAAAGAVAPFPSAALAESDFTQDFDTACREIGSAYAYFEEKATSWKDVPRLYAEDLRRVTTRDEFVRLLERVLDELYDPHAQLNVNLPSSPRLVPSGADLWAEWRNGKAVITDVRAGSTAERAGIKGGSVVLAIDGIPIADAVEARLGRSYPHTVAAAREWALRAVLAGRHDARRVLRLRVGGTTRTVELPAGDPVAKVAETLSHSWIRPGIGLIRLHDSLGDSSTIGAFDRALEELRGSRAMILDLRDTPSGGNSTVARAILGRFVRSEQPYQKHVLPAEERETGVRRSWLELVSPRGEFIYERPVAVLVGRWTGSMGEGLAIGFDATKAGRIAGTPMARLAGATYRIDVPRTGIGINLPAERLYHVDGTPREAFVPRWTVDAARSEPGADPFVAAALRALGEP